MTLKTFKITYDFFNYDKGTNGWDSACVVIQHRSEGFAKDLFWDEVDGHIGDTISASTVTITGISEMDEDDEPNITWAY